MLSKMTNNLFHQIVNLLIFETLFILALISHLKTMLTNPGTVPKGFFCFFYKKKNINFRNIN